MSLSIEENIAKGAEALQHIAMALEAQTEMLAKHYKKLDSGRPLVEVKSEPVEVKADTLDTLDTVAPPAAEKVEKKEKVTELWDPRNMPIQTRYASREKQVAIDAVIKELGIVCPVSWTFPKRHQAILDHVAHAPEVPEKSSVLKEKEPMTWPEFKADFLTMMKVLGKDACREAVLAVTGQPNSNPETCEGHYEAILLELERHNKVEEEDTPDLTNTVEPAAKVEAAPRDELVNLARTLITKGVQPPKIQEAIAHIATGVHAVPDAQIAEAIGCLQLLNI